MRLLRADLGCATVCMPFVRRSDSKIDTDSSTFAFQASDVTEGESLHLCSFLAAVTLYRCVPHRGDEHIVLRIFPFTCAPVHARASSASEQRPMKPLSKECDGCVPIWDVQQRVCLSCGEATARSPLTQVRSLSKHPKVSEGGRMGAGGVQARR